MTHDTTIQVTEQSDLRVDDKSSKIDPARNVLIVVTWNLVCVSHE